MGYSTIRTLIISAILLTAQNGFAQQLNIANDAARLCQAKQLEPARKRIEAALQSEDEKNHVYTIFVAGFVYKECYKEFESENRNSPYREKAVEYFLKAQAMDKNREHASNISTSLKYLASTYYNDALMRVREFDMSNSDEPEKIYQNFRRLMRESEPGCNLNTFDKEFHQQMGTRYFDLWQLDIDHPELSERALGHFKSAIMMDSTDCMLHYNVGVLYYNRAVFLYRSISPDTDMSDLIDIQMRASDLIKNKAMPAMKKADKLCPEHGEVLRGLLYMNKALERESDVEYFKDEIKRLIEEGKMKNLYNDKK